MKQHRTQNDPTFVDDGYNELTEVVAVETFYDTSIQTWTSIAVDAEGDQVLAASYSSVRAEARDEMIRVVRYAGERAVANAAIPGFTFDPETGEYTPERGDEVAIVAADVHGNVPPVGATGTVEHVYADAPVTYQVRGAGLGGGGNGIAYFPAGALAPREIGGAK
jgi:hypothetical protein